MIWVKSTTAKLVAASLARAGGSLFCRDLCWRPVLVRADAYAL